VSSAETAAETPWQIERYDRELASVVASLRRLADEVERVGKPYTGPHIIGSPNQRYATAAEQVQQAVAWGIANAGAYRLIGPAADADAYSREQAES
jgi:hypothetical protein